MVLLDKSYPSMHLLDMEVSRGRGFHSGTVRQRPRPHQADLLLDMEEPQPGLAASRGGFHPSSSAVRPRPRPQRDIPRPLCCKCAAQTSETAGDWCSGSSNNLHFNPPPSQMNCLTDAESFQEDASDARNSDFVSWNIPPVNVADLGSPVSHWDTPNVADDYPKTGLGISVPAPRLSNHADTSPSSLNAHNPSQASKTAIVQPVRVINAVSARECPSTAHHEENSRKTSAAAAAAAPAVAAVTPVQRAVVKPTVQAPPIVVPDAVSSYCSVTGSDSKKDLLCLVRTYDQLDKSGFYYPKLDMPGAKKKLSRSSVGTFLLRDSSDPRFLFSLSIRTGRGTTSIRIAYGGGHFLLDCEDKAKNHMPSADCVIKLVQAYVSQTATPAANSCVFLESSGRRDTPVLMSKPCIVSPLSLKNLSRKSLNAMVLQTPAGADSLLQKLPLDLRGYMDEYKYWV